MERMNKHWKTFAFMPAFDASRLASSGFCAARVGVAALSLACSGSVNQTGPSAESIIRDTHPHSDEDIHSNSHNGEHSDDATEHGEGRAHGDPEVAPPKEDALPVKLSETGLYSNIRTKEISDDILHYAPQYALWSDGATKERWAFIPPDTQVDNSDVNNWSVPVGSRFFKEFSIGDQRVETRLIERVGDGPRDFAFVSYLWNEAQTEATKVDPAGLPNALGTSHDIPSKMACLQCHGTYPLGGGRPSRMLGFSLIQLSHEDAGISLDALSDYLTQPVPSYTIPGDETAQDALGYLHANCGNCHHDGPDRVPQVDLSFWLDAEATTIEQTGTWRTAVNQPNVLFNDQHVVGRIIPGHPEDSAVIYRMQQRGNNAQMPPVATEIIDEAGIADVADWIRSL